LDNAIKPVLNETQLKDIVAYVFGENTGDFVAVELKDGFFNGAYAITLDQGKRYVLKLAPLHNSGFMRYERNMMQTEVEVLRLLREKTDIPVPQVHAYETASPVYEGSFFVMDFIEGDPYNKVKETLTEVEREAIEHQLGVFTSSINSLRGKRFGYYALEEMQGDSWSQVFLSMIDSLMIDASHKEVELPAPADEITAACKRFISSLDEVKIPSLVHWDLWEGNIFVKDGQIVGIIDTERALWGDPLMEYYFRSFIDSPAHLKGYGREILTESECQRILMYDLYLALILHIECTYRGYTNEGHINWAKGHLQRTWDSVLADINRNSESNEVS
jgi:aminoglycoside phosphotransferase (APT) family kinase protein